MRKWLIGAILVLIAYIGYPYLTLYWIDHALLTDDKGALESLVDWPVLRQQLKATSSSPSSSRPRRRSKKTGLPEFLAPP